jgi:hypothetical protein
MALIKLAESDGGEVRYNVNKDFEPSTAEEAIAAFVAATGLTNIAWTSKRTSLLVNALAIPKFKGEEPDWKELREQVLSLPRKEKLRGDRNNG